MQSIEWNEKGQRLIPPMERDRFERGEPPRRLEGRFELDAERGELWYREGEHSRHVGNVSTSPAAAAPDRETHAARDLGAVSEGASSPPRRSRKVSKKAPKARKRK